MAETVLTGLVVKTVAAMLMGLAAKTAPAHVVCMQVLLQPLLPLPLSLHENQILLLSCHQI